MFPMFLAVLYVYVQAAAGYLFAVRVLKVRTQAAAVGFGALLGPAFVMESTNALGFLLPHRAAFATPIALLAFGSLLMLRLPKRETALVKTPKFVLLALLVTATLVGFTQARVVPSDFLSWGRSPLVATMAEGNLPPMEVTGPWSRLRYHYGPEILVASLQSVTGVDMLTGYNPQPFMGAIAVVFFVAALLFGITGSWTAAGWGSVLAIGGTGLIWINVVPLVIDLYRAFVLHVPIDGPFRELAHMTWSPITNPISILFNHRSSAIGYALLYGLLYCFTEACVKRRERTLWILSSILLCGALSLTMEIGTLAFGTGMVGFLLVLLIARNTRLPFRDALTTALWILVPSAVITVVQGGILSLLGGGHSAGFLMPQLTTYFEPWGARRIYVGEWLFFRDFGLPLFLLPIFGWYCVRSIRRAPELTLLLGIGLTFFLVPLLTKFSPRPHEAIRLFWGATSFFSLLIGVMFSETLFVSTKKWIRWGAVAVLVSMLLPAATYFAMCSVFPTRHFEILPLFAKMIPSDSEKLVPWVKANTTLKDYFHVRPGFDQVTFTTNTGRFAIGPLYGDGFPPEKLKFIADIERSCSPAAFRELEITYLVVINAERAAWFSRTCNPKSWKLVFDGGEATKETFPRIYKAL